MKVMVMISISILLAIYAIPDAYSQAKKKADKATEEWRYDIECMGIGSEGTKLIKVWSYSKNPIFSITQAKKNAIHAMMFKGFAGNKATGCPTQSPLIVNGDIEKEKANFFKDFFDDGGAYMRYVSTANEDVTDRIKVGKEYKTAVVVTVMYSQLRKYLQQQDIVDPIDKRF